MSESHPRPNCALATGNITPEAMEVMKRIEANPSSEFDGYDLTTPACLERACGLSIGDHCQVLSALVHAVDLQPTADGVKEWLPEDCPIRAETGPYAEPPKKQDL